MDKRIEEFKEMLLRELDETTRGGGLTPETICNADKVIDMIYDIQKITYGEEMTRQYAEDGYSGYSSRGGYSRDGRRGRDADNDGRYNEASYGGSYGRGGSYGGGSYGGGSYEGGSYDGGSYNGGGSYSGNNSYGYSRHDEKEALVADLERAMQKAGTQKDKENIQRLIAQMRNQ